MNIYVKVIFKSGAMTIRSVGKGVFSTNRFGKTGYPYAKINVNLYS